MPDNLFKKIPKFGKFNFGTAKEHKCQNRKPGIKKNFWDPYLYWNYYKQIWILQVKNVVQKYMLINLSRNLGFFERFGPNEGPRIKYGASFKVLLERSLG
jgi:hypothetical protein